MKYDCDGLQMLLRNNDSVFVLGGLQSAGYG